MKVLFVGLWCLALWTAFGDEPLWGVAGLIACLIPLWLTARRENAL